MKAIELLALVADNLRRVADRRIMTVSYNNDHKDGEIFVDIFENNVSQTFLIKAREVEPNDDNNEPALALPPPQPAGPQTAPVTGANGQHVGNREEKEQTKEANSLVVSA